MSHESSPIPTVAQPPGLSRRTLGVPALVFMTIAASAPLTVVAGGYPANFAVTGVLGVPLSFLVLGACLTLFTVGYAAMSSRIRNAGAFYAYIAQGLGKRTGVGASFVALTAYNSIQIAVYGLFGFASATFINEKTGADVPWWATAGVAFLVVAWLGINKVDFVHAMLHERGIKVGTHYNPLNWSTAFQKRGYKRGQFPNAEKVGESVVTLIRAPRAGRG